MINYEYQLKWQVETYHNNNNSLIDETLLISVMKELLTLPSTTTTNNNKTQLNSHSKRKFNSSTQDIEDLIQL